MSEAGHPPYSNVPREPESRDARKGASAQRRRRRAARPAGAPPASGRPTPRYPSHQQDHSRGVHTGQPSPTVRPEVVAALEDATTLSLPDGLRRLYAAPPAGSDELMYRPDLPASDPMSVAAAFSALQGSSHPFPANLVPLSPVDDRSIAAVLCQHTAFDGSRGLGFVVRWHMDDVPFEHQADILDVDAMTYIESVLAEGRARTRGLTGIESLTRRYREQHIRQTHRGETSVSRPKAIRDQACPARMPKCCGRAGRVRLSVTIRRARRAVLADL